MRRFVPQIVNGLAKDKAYENEPERTVEILQTWEALSSMLESMADSNDVSKNLNKCADAIKLAEQLYSEIKFRYRLDPKSDDNHLEPLREGINLFKKTAEI